MISATTFAIILQFALFAGGDKQTWYQDAEGRAYYCYDQEKRECYWADGMRYWVGTASSQSSKARPVVTTPTPPTRQAPTTAVRPANDRTLTCFSEVAQTRAQFESLPLLREGSDDDGLDEWDFREYRAQGSRIFGVPILSARREFNSLTAPSEEVFRAYVSASLDQAVNATTASLRARCTTRTQTSCSIVMSPRAKVTIAHTSRGVSISCAYH